MELRRRALARGLITGTIALSTAVGGSLPATAEDVESLRARAQSVADEISMLEHSLATLRHRQERLEADIARSNHQIGILELRIHDADAALEAATDRYVERAVEAYKGGSTSRLALLLSARSLAEMITLADATSEAAEADTEVLDDLLEARADAERAQEAIDAKKQKLMSARLRAEAVESEMATTLVERRATFRDLEAEIKKLERAARRRAAQAPEPQEALEEVLEPTAPDPDRPSSPSLDGFVGTGVTFEGIASWYGPGFEGRPTASGQIFDPDKFTAASRDLPLGTWLYVEHGNRGVVVLVNDRGPYIEDRVLDLSQAAAEAIGISGLGWIRAEIVIKKRP